ncbi:MAG: family 16 glycoside hydrolase, partial [Planctomycetota bacterium]
SSGKRLSFDARIARGTSAAVFLRDSFPAQAGYGMRLDAFSKENERAGSLIDLASIRGQLAPPNLWFHVDFVVRDESKGTRVQTFLNGVKVADSLDADRRHPNGSLRFSGPVGGTLELRNWSLERLPPQ